MFSGHLHLHFWGGQQGALFLPTLVPSPKSQPDSMFWATPHPQIRTHASSRVEGCSVRFLRAGMSTLVRTVWLATHPQRSEASGPCISQSERGCGQESTSPGPTHLATGDSERAGLDLS